MVVAAVIAEYNPFHNGHAFHITETRRAGATHVAAIMSGNFTQRGAAALCEKRVRAACALLGGADLVLELPVPFAMATAQRFAAGAVSVACAMGCVDLLSFGSESGYITMLRAAADAVDSLAVCERMNEYLATGVTFAKARQNAVSELCGDEIADLLSEPNDSLAIEYLRALRDMDSPIAPFAVRREGAGHDAAAPLEGTASASYLRALARSGDPGAAAAMMPKECAARFLRAFEEKTAPFDEAALDRVILGVLRRMTPEEMGRLPDLSEGLENRILAAIRQATTLDEVFALAKSKRYTAARIRRVVMSAFLGLEASLSSRPAPYLRVLGFNARGREILGRMKETAKKPVSDSLAYLRNLGGEARLFAEQESRATDLYLLGLPQVRPCGYDFVEPGVRLL